MTDPISIMATIGVGLGLIDQFTDLADRWQNREGGRHRGKAEVKDDVLIITRDVANEEEEPEIVQLAHIEANLDIWDGPKYKMLSKRTQQRWSLLLKYEAEDVGLGPTERANLNFKIEQTLEELCGDFRAMIAIIERVTDHSLPDHYQLYSQCDGAQ